MTTSPYDGPEFAKEYAMAQVDRQRNRYEWEVTQPAMIQFLDEDTQKIIDYGCGAGIFTAGMNNVGRAHLNPGLESIGVDASPAMLHYAEILGRKATGVSFREWNAAANDSDLQDHTADRVFAKLVLNYVSPDDLHHSVMPRLRSCLNDKGLLVAVLPNPLREVGYSNSKYATTETLDINVGNFGDETATQSYRHTYEDVIRAADNAGFAYGRALGLPSVRFEPYKQWPWSTERLMKIAHPATLVLDTMNAAKRWVYVFGATKKSADAFDLAVTHFSNWRTYQFPEIADRMHILIPLGHEDPDVDLPIDSAHKEVLYEYINGCDPTNKRVVVLKGQYAESINPRQKLKLAQSLAQTGIREIGTAQDYLIDS